MDSIENLTHESGPRVPGPFWDMTESWDLNLEDGAERNKGIEKIAGAEVEMDEPCRGAG